MLIGDKEFKPLDSTYLVSKDGEIYSTYKGGVLKHYKDHNGYHRVDIHGRHMKVHKLVYMVWGSGLNPNEQVNHIDDNKNNNHIDNLYAGSQKENISDCVANKHRVGHITSVTVMDKRVGKIIKFPTVRELIKYTGHSVKNGSLSHMQYKKWFQDRFDVIEVEGVTTIESYKSIRADYISGVENKADTHEASRVGLSLSQSEAQGACTHTC